MTRTASQVSSQTRTPLTLEQWRYLTARTSIGAERVERVAQRVWELEQAGSDRACVWHASHELYVEDVEAGVIPSGRCSLCGGRIRPDREAHDLCVARAERGVPVQPRDEMLTPCDCTPCSLERGGR